MLPNDPTLVVRFVTIGMTIAIGVGTVAAGIIVGVVVGRQAGNSQFTATTVTLVQSNVSIAIARVINDNELQQFYDPAETLSNLSTSLKKQAIQVYPNTTVNFLVESFVNEPVLESSLHESRRRVSARQLGVRPSIVLIYGSIYFTQNYTSDQVRQIFENYQQTITLKNILGQASPGPGTFSSKYSTFSDPVPLILTVTEAEALLSVSISVSNVTIVTYTPSTTTLPMSLTSNIASG